MGSGKGNVRVRYPDNNNNRRGTRNDSTGVEYSGLDNHMGAFWKYARTHEILVESRIMFKHKIRRLEA